MTTTPRLWKSLTQVNTSDAPVVPGGTASQAEGQIAPLPDGGYVVVWVDGSGMYNPDGFAIVGQRYDAAGNKVGGEVKISQFSDGDRVVPAVTVLANGNIAVAFVDIFGLDDNLYVRIFDPALNLVRDDIIDTGRGPDVRTVHHRLGRRQLRRLLYGRSGAPQSPISSCASRERHRRGGWRAQYRQSNRLYKSSRELATLSNGNFVAVYRDEFNGTLNDTDIRYGIFTPAGTPVAGPAMSRGLSASGWKPIRTSPRCEMAASSSCGPTPIAP